MPSADQVPVISPHSRMQWHKWVVLTAGSTGSALRAVRPPNLHITPDTRRGRTTTIQRSSRTDSIVTNFYCTEPAWRLLQQYLPVSDICSAANWSLFDCPRRGAGGSPNGT